MTDPRKDLANGPNADTTVDYRSAGASSATQARTPSGGIASDRTASDRTATVPAQPSEHPEGATWREPDSHYVATTRGGGVLAAAAQMSWAAVAFGGLCMIAAGIVLLVWPHATLTVIAILIGLALIVSGLTRLYEGFTAREESGGMRTAYVVIGLLAMLGGLYFLRHHALSIWLVAFVAGVYFIMHGIADIGVAASVRVPGRGLRAILGVFSIAAGVVMVAWPAVTLVLLLTIVGAWLLFYGLTLVMMAFGLRRAAKRMSAAPSGRLATST
jgi:uncharacterized membrane protein HdeD (DUF308 family)